MFKLVNVQADTERQVKHLPYISSFLSKCLLVHHLELNFICPFKRHLFLNLEGLFQYYGHDIITPANITDFHTAEWNPPRQFAIMGWAHMYYIHTHTQSERHIDAHSIASFLQKVYSKCKGHGPSITKI